MIPENDVPMNKVLLFLVSGKAGVGKSFCCDFIRSSYADMNYSTINLPFAEGVKKVAYSMSWDGKKDERGRRLLQKIGNAGREYDKDVWVSMALQKFLDDPSYPRDVVTVDDWRFTNEYGYALSIPIFKVIGIRVNSPERCTLTSNPTLCNDESEIGLDNFLNFSYVVQNPKDKPDAVTSQLANILEYETLRNRR